MCRSYRANLRSFLFAALLSVTIGCGDSNQGRIEKYEKRINKISVPTDSDGQAAAFAKLDAIADELEPIFRTETNSFRFRAEALRVYANAKVKSAGIDFPTILAELVYGENESGENILDRVDAATATVDISRTKELVRAANQIAVFLTYNSTTADQEQYLDLTRDLHFQRGFIHLMKAAFLGTELSTSANTDDFETLCDDLDDIVASDVRAYIQDANIARMVFTSDSMANLADDNEFVSAATELIDLVSDDLRAQSFTELAADESPDTETPQLLDPGDEAAGLVAQSQEVQTLCDQLARVKGGN